MKCAKSTTFVPFIGIASQPSDSQNDIAAKLILMDRCHVSYAGTEAACSRVPGTVVNKMLSERCCQKDR